MDSFLSRYKNLLVLVIVLVAQIIGLAAQIRRPNPSATDTPTVRLLRYWAISMVSPPEKLLRYSGGGIRGLWSNYLDLRHVRDRNRDLQAEVARFQLEQAALLEDARQGQRLQRLLAFREHYVYSTVPAQVIGTAGTDQSRVLYIDKGSADGLRPDMPVITPNGIVGKLKDVFRHTSQVLEISDQTSGAGVLLESTRLRGVLRGNALGQPEIINMLPDERVKAGERVVTSGGDQIFPRGLPVGVVDRVADDPQNPPFIDILIKPAANLSRLEEVLVVTKTGGDLPPAEKKDIAQSQAAAGDMSQQRAADILAERLPGLVDPNAPPGERPDAKIAATATGATAPPLRPPAALREDRYTPNATPPAADLTPGKTFTVSGTELSQPAAKTPSAAAKPARQNKESEHAAPAPARPPHDAGEEH